MTTDYTIMNDLDFNTAIPIYDHTTEQRIALLHKALDWLDANPDKHITGTLAEDENGKSVEPDSPDAQCWCVLGRMVVEGGLATSRFATEDPADCGISFYPTLDHYTKPFTDANTCSVIFGMADASSALGPAQLQRNRNDLRARYPLTGEAT